MTCNMRNIQLIAENIMRWLSLSLSYIILMQKIIFAREHIFLSGGLSTPEMAFGLVSIQDHLDPEPKRPVRLLQPFCQVLMYGRR